MNLKESLVKKLGLFERQVMYCHVCGQIIWTRPQRCLGETCLCKNCAESIEAVERIIDIYENEKNGEH